MKQALKSGISFGITSGIITTLGLMVGLNSGTHSKLIVIGGILTIAVADAFSDALGMHMSEESTDGSTTKQVWEATFATFIAKFLFAMTFVIPVYLLDLNTAIIASIAWGLLILTILSYIIAKNQNEKAYKAIFEHLITAAFVILATNQIGLWIAERFG